MENQNHQSFTSDTSISACLIAYNEQEHLPRALASIAFCDEIIVVDSGSVDDTVAIAHAAGAKVIKNEWPGFARQRNVALSYANSDWILEIDCDEVVTPELQIEIKKFLSHPPKRIDIAGIPIRHIFFDMPLGFAARYPDYRQRLFLRSNYTHNEERAVHEGLWPKGPTWAFTSPIEHELASNLPEALIDTWRYATLETEQLPSRIPFAAFVRGMFLRPLLKFIYRAAVEGGWRDGWRGLLKLGLDCSADTLTWLMALKPRGKRKVQDKSETLSPSGHFAAPRARQGPVRIVAISRGKRSDQKTTTWAKQAQEMGCDVALITTSRSKANGNFPIQQIRHSTPVELIRALMALDQLRPIDITVCGDKWSQLLIHTVPKALRGSRAALTTSDSPKRAISIRPKAYENLAM